MNDAINKKNRKWFPLLVQKIFQFELRLIVLNKNNFPVLKPLFVIQNISNIITDRLSDLCDLRFNIMKIVRGLSITN